MAGVRIGFKNVSSQRNKTVGVLTQDTSLLWDRERVTCFFGVDIVSEEVLLNIRATNNGVYNKDILFGEQSRFLTIQYIKTNPDEKSVGDQFQELSKGKTTAEKYSSIKVNATNNQFFNSNTALRVGEGNNYVLKSVCTDGAYVDAIDSYEIGLTQRMFNIKQTELTTPFIIDYKPGKNSLEASFVNTGKLKPEIFSELYIQAPSETPYNLGASFFGVENDFKTNNFWVLPEQFKSHGITYEIYTEGDISRCFINIEDFKSKISSFSVLNNVLTLKGSSSFINLDFFSYKFLQGYNEETSGVFNDYTIYEVSIEQHLNLNVNDLSANDVFIITKNVYNATTQQYNIGNQFRFKNNIAEGIVGYYNELDETKTIQNSQGYFDENVMKRDEILGSFLSSLTNIQWYTELLKRTQEDASQKAIIFNFDLNDSRSVDGFQGQNQKFRFIGENNDNANKNQISQVNFSELVFNNVEFSGTNNKGIAFIDCDFNRAVFSNCDFSGCEFRNCNFSNTTSYNNNWSNYYYGLTLGSPEEYLQTSTTGYKFFNGMITGPEIDISNNFIKTTFKNYSGNINVIDGISNSANQIFTVFDVSSNDSRCDTYNFRSIVTVNKHVRLDISLGQVKFNNINGLTTTSALEAALYNTTTRPVYFDVIEHPSTITANSVNSRIIINNDSDINNNNNSGITIENFKYYFTNYYATDDDNTFATITNNDNAVVDQNFYYHQFQKDITNPFGLKIIGHKNDIDFDNPNIGSWSLGKFPYNTRNNRDMVLTYGIQNEDDIYYELSYNELHVNDLDNHPDYNQGYYGKIYTTNNGISVEQGSGWVRNNNENPLNYTPGWIIKNRGPLPYSRLDEEYTYNLFGNVHPVFDISYARFRIRKANANYKFRDSTSNLVKIHGPINYISQTIPDISSNSISIRDTSSQLFFNTEYTL
jgi:uncharacterized protein YjbI with pentapeptide repeats